jgi:putative ATP-binding cassette transporter
MRALAGLWPFGDGTIDAPVDAKLMFIPQQSYLPIGTLKAALSYPSTAEVFSDEDCREALRACNLNAYGTRLEESGHWAKMMSPGEQQRLAAARVLLHKPDFMFLDEATSALDAENEMLIYTAIIDALPNAAIVSVAHRESVTGFHESRIEIERASAERVVA